MSSFISVFDDSPFRITLGKSNLIAVASRLKTAEHLGVSDVGTWIDLFPPERAAGLLLTLFEARRITEQPLDGNQNEATRADAAPSTRVSYS